MIPDTGPQELEDARQKKGTYRNQLESAPEADLSEAGQRGLFVPQSDHGVDAHGAPCGNVAGE